MDFVSIDELLDDVLAEAPGCPIYTARDRIRWAAIEFCKQTGVSVETTAEIDVDANEELLSLPSPGGHVRVWQLLWIKTTTGPINPIDRRSVNDRGAIWDGLEGDRPLGYARRSNDEIQLIPMPTASLAEEITVHCSYIPTRTAERLDAVLVNEYRDAIVHGALSRLLKMPGETWYDRLEARERQDWFAIACSEARALADKDFQTGERRVQMSPMA